MFGREFLLIKKEKNPEFKTILASFGNFGCPLLYGQLIEDPSFFGTPCSLEDSAQAQHYLS